MNKNEILRTSGHCRFNFNMEEKKNPGKTGATLTKHSSAKKRNRFIAD